jgi:hypothetical protein
MSIFIFQGIEVIVKLTIPMNQHSSLHYLCNSSISLQHFRQTQDCRQLDIMMPTDATSCRTSLIKQIPNSDVSYEECEIPKEVVMGVTHAQEELHLPNGSSTN